MSAKSAENEEKSTLGHISVDGSQRNKHFEERLRFLNIDEQTREDLRKIKPTLDKNLPDILGNFYELLAQWPELSGMFSDKDHQNVAKKLQIAHWSHIATGKFDEEYQASSDKIGHAHNRIGLAPRWYIGGYAALMGGMFSALIQDHLSSGLSFGRNKNKEFEQLLHSFLKAAMLDMDLAISTYFDAGADEFSALLEQMTHDFDSNVANVIKELAIATDNLESTSNNLNIVATTGKERAATLQEAASIASENVSAVASASEEMSSSINEINSQIHRANQITTTAVDKGKQAGSTVGELQESSQKVGEIIKLIRDIAEQTNLLALNATIESARAGEAGKGFAVVASEVKNLAGETAKATEEIASQITTIQESTQNTVNVITDITETVQQINETTMAITAAMEEQTATIQEIVKNTHSAADRTSEVGNIAKDVAQSAEETQSAASTLGTASQELSKRTEELRGEVEVFLANLKASK